MPLAGMLAIALLNRSLLRGRASGWVGTATSAGIKAFVINVVGDVGMVLGTFFLFREMGVLDYTPLFDGVHDAFSRNDPTLVAAMILFLVGAFAKSAQIPLHTWLPDAME